MNNIFPKTLLVAAMALSALCSCNKKEEIPIDHTTYHPGSNFTFAISMAQSESLSHDILITALRFGTDTTLWHRSGYPTVTSSSATSYPRTVTIDFGNDDTTTLVSETGDMRTRSGILNVQIDANWHATGSTVTISTNNLRVSGMITINGRMQFANRGLRNYYGNQVHTFDYIINDALISTNNTDLFKYSASKTYHLTVGQGTPTINDDVFHISGSASMQKDTAIAELTIKSDYYAPYSCFWFRDGKAEITEGTILRQISFSNSNCAPMAEIIFKPHTQKPDSVITYAELP
ncbi:MAG: hypothetical protein IJP95_05355 [Bacteroidales bacterium]|nr:hypothetical protein [Bacteroidales bacterium]